MVMPAEPGSDVLPVLPVPARHERQRVLALPLLDVCVVLPALLSLVATVVHRRQLLSPGWMSPHDRETEENNKSMLSGQSETV